MKSSILFVLIFTSYSTHCQEYKTEPTNERAKCVFGELGGNGLLFSANYDTRFAKKQNGFGARAGIGVVPTFLTSAVTFPVALNYLVGKGPHYFEAGAGVTITSVTGFLNFIENRHSTTIIFFVPGLGYRYQPLRKGFTGRIFISPLFAEGDGAFWGGLSAGYKF